MMASTSLFAAAQKDDLDWNQPAVEIEQTSFYKTYEGAGWHAPEDTIILMQHGKRNSVPLSLFTAEAITAYDAGRRPALISPDVAFQPASLGPYDELDKTLSYLAWEGAWKAHLAAMERYRRKFWNRLRLAESNRTADGRAAPPTLAGWDENEWDAACNYVGIKSTEVLDIKQSGDSLTLRQLALVLGGLKSGEETDAASQQGHNYSDRKISLSTITAQKAAERLAEETRVLDAQRLRGTWLPFDFPASLKLRIPQQQQSQQHGPRKGPMSTTPSAYPSPTPTSTTSSQPPLPAYPPPPPPAGFPAPSTPTPSSTQPYSYVGGPIPQGPSTAPHPSSRLSPPSATDQLVAHAAVSAKFCGACGSLGPQGPHFWGECEDYNKGLFFRIGQALYRKDAPTPNVPCCANFFLGKCSRPGEACPRTYYHVCSGCGEYNEHTRIDCPTSPKISVPAATKPRLPTGPQRGPEYPNKKARPEGEQRGGTPQDDVVRDLLLSNGTGSFR
ncbi:hypothetical protein JCM1841_001211 [Sporobolomyces salmonicolor]